jgi:hypothetical protein
MFSNILSFRNIIVFQILSISLAHRIVTLTCFSLSSTVDMLQREFFAFSKILHEVRTSAK